MNFRNANLTALQEPRWLAGEEVESVVDEKLSVYFLVTNHVQKRCFNLKITDKELLEIRMKTKRFNITSRNVHVPPKEKRVAEE